MTDKERPRRVRTSPGNDPVRKEGRKVTVTSAAGAVIFERGPGRSIGVRISSDSGSSERVTIPGGMNTMRTVMKKLGPQGR